MQDTTYPAREKFFANKFIRLMVKTCLANELGTEVFAFLTVIASTEDAAGYKRGVNYYDGQLMPLLNLRSKSTMTRIRKKAVNSGWLHYIPGNRGQASVYWVKIPTHAHGIDDHPTDENSSGIVLPGEPIRELIENYSETIREPFENSTGALLPIPIPTPIPMGLGGKTKNAQVSADMASEFWFKVPGFTRPTLPEFTEEFNIKLDWLEANGRDETELIWAKIRDPTRDPGMVRTINQMWKFWEYCGLEEKKSAKRRPEPASDHYTGLQAPTL